MGHKYRASGSESDLTYAQEIELPITKDLLKTNRIEYTLLKTSHITYQLPSTAHLTDCLYLLLLPFIYTNTYILVTNVTCI